MCNMKALSPVIRKSWPRLKLFKSRSNVKVKVTRSHILYHVKGLDTRNTHVQKESPITSGKKVIAKVKVFVHANYANADARAMTLAPGHSSRLA